MRDFILQWMQHMVCKQINYMIIHLQCCWISVINILRISYQWFNGGFAGLEYLHNGCKPPIIHRDLKASNILLNEHMQAKITDFGLPRAFATENDSHVSTRPAGTLRYLDPA